MPQVRRWPPFFLKKRDRRQSAKFRCVGLNFCAEISTCSKIACILTAGEGLSDPLVQTRSGYRVLAGSRTGALARGRGWAPHGCRESSSFLLLFLQHFLGRPFSRPWPRSSGKTGRGGCPPPVYRGQTLFSRLCPVPQLPCQSCKVCEVMIHTLQGGG